MDVVDVDPECATERRPRGEAAERTARRVRRRWRGVALAAGAAAAVVIVIVWWTRRATPEPPHAPVALATAELRATEGRISYAAADRYRPYEVARAGPGAPPVAPAVDAIPLGTLADLEHRGDLHGVAAAFLVMNDAQRAAAYLDRAAPGPDVASDRALVQRAAGHLTDALITLDGVLEAAPRHPQALWNRALVLRDLGLSLSAAAGFEAVAALREPGWSEEARRTAAELSARVVAHKAAFERLAFTDGPHLATVPGGVTAEIARRFPGMTRLRFYDAVRSAGSADAVRALAPLAAVLDATYGGTALAGYVERIARAEFSRRAPLARRYAALLAGQRLEPAAADQLFAALRAARQDDILFGALVVVSAGHVPLAQIPELRRLAGELRDPWFELLAVEKAAAALASGAEYATAEALLIPALARCTTVQIEYRCASLDSVLGESYLLNLRLADARRVIAEGWARAQRAGEWLLEQEFLKSLARLETVEDDVAGSTLPLVRAYVGEVVLRRPDLCELAVWDHELTALVMVSRLDFARARDQLAQIAAMKQACPSRQTDLALAEVKAHVLRDPSAASADAVAAARAEIAALRAQASGGVGAQAALDQIEGRLLIDRDHAAGAALLERAIGATRSARSEDVDARRARSYAYSILTLDAARAGDWDRVWRLLGDDAGIAPAPRCALGAAVEDRTSMVVVRDAGGATRGVFDPAWPGPAVDARTLVPAALRDALQSCPEIEVVAPPPVQGLPGLLPAGLAWSYRSGADPRRAGATSERRQRVVVADAEPPATLGLPRLLPWRSMTPPDVMLDGASATPSRVLGALADASFVEIHAHGMVKAAVSDASFLMLSPEVDGSYALTAGAIRHQPLRGHPIVILAACHAATAASYRHETWSLPAAFLAAGARAVIASNDVISDGDAGGFFDELRARIERGATPAVALNGTRTGWLAAHPAAAWTRSLMVFQ